MEAHTLACRAVVGKEVGTQVDKVVDIAPGIEEDIAPGIEENMAPGMEEGIALHMVEDTVVCKALGKQDCSVEDIWVCKVLHKQACIVEDIWAGKADKLEGMVHNNRHCNGWNSLSTRVPRHPKKATRLVFPVVFSLKDSLC